MFHVKLMKIKQKHKINDTFGDRRPIHSLGVHYRKNMHELHTFDYKVHNSFQHGIKTSRVPRLSLQSQI